MKCPYCNGNGGYLNMNQWCFCEQCDGTGQDGLSNDEWRKTCSAEEFAEWLYNNMITITTRYAHCGKDGLMAWLKEKHEDAK